jgi:hypothetical protein
MNNIEILRVLLGEFYEKIVRLNDLVARDAHFPKAKNKIKVAIGMRRVGKTYLLYQEILKLIEEGVDKTAILYINFEDDRLNPLDQQKLALFIEAFYSLYPENHERKCYFFLDEIQNAPGWAAVVRRFHDTKNVEIFLTGSSAKLLSKEIASSLRGRSIALEVWPYSFNEFLRARKVQVDRTIFSKKTEDQLNHLFQQYLSIGGFPEVTFYDTESRQKSLREYLDVAIYRDIIERHEIRNPTIIKNMLLSMMHYVGRPFAITKLHHDFKTRGFAVGKDMLYHYADHIEDAYIAFLSPLYSKSMRKSQTNPRKLYVIDPGLVRVSTLDYESDLGRLFENLVYLDLKRLGYHVNYYTTREGYEIDFLATTPQGKQKIFQAAWNFDDPKTRMREERALQAAMQELNISGEIITLKKYLESGVNLFSV